MELPRGAWDSRQPGFGRPRRLFGHEPTVSDAPSCVSKRSDGRFRFGDITMVRPDPAIRRARIDVYVQSYHTAVGICCEDDRTSASHWEKPHWNTQTLSLI